MNTFKFKTVSPDGTIFDGECTSLVIPAADGLYGIYANHAPVTAATLPGKVKIGSDGSEQSIEVKKGLFHFENNEAILLTE